MALRLRLRPTRRRVIIGAVALVIVAGGGVGAWAATRSPDPATTSRLVTVSTQTLRQSVSSSGTIEPAQQENLDFAVSGQVTAVNVTTGQQVTAGQALATVNSASLTATVAQAQATLSTDQSKLSSDSGSSASTAQVAADQAAVTAATNQLTDAQNALAEATLTSPITGTVAAVNLTVDQQVSGGSSSTSSSSGSSGSGGGSGGSGGSGSGGSGTGGSGSGSNSSSSSSSSSSGSSAQIVVISNGSYVVNASVDDTEVGQVKTGDQAVITPDGATTPVYGTVTSVAMLASGSSSVPSYPVTIGVTGSPSGLYPGAGATVSIVVKQLTDVLAVPTTAIHYENGHAAVYEMSGEQQVSHEITTGATQSGYTQVLSGLSAGDQIVVQVPSGGTGRTGTGGTGGTGRTGGGGFGGGGFGGGGLGGGSGRTRTGG